MVKKFTANTRDAGSIFGKRSVGKMGWDDGLGTSWVGNDNPLQYIWRVGDREPGGLEEWDMTEITHACTISNTNTIKSPMIISLSKHLSSQL